MSSIITPIMCQMSVTLSRYFYRIGSYSVLLRRQEPRPGLKVRSGAGLVSDARFGWKATSRFHRVSIAVAQRTSENGQMTIVEIIGMLGGDRHLAFDGVEDGIGEIDARQP